MFRSGDMSKVPQRTASIKQTDTIDAALTTSVNEGVKKLRFTNKDRLLVENTQHNSFSIKRAPRNYKSTSRRTRSLLLTLIGLSLVFLACNFPSLIAKIAYLLSDTENKQPISTIMYVAIQVSSLLLALNSSVNFLIYMFFGADEFRSQFKILLYNLFDNIVCCYRL